MEKFQGCTGGRILDFDKAAWASVPEWVILVKGGNISYANPAALKGLGYESLTCVVGMPFSQILNDAYEDCCTDLNGLLERQEQPKLIRFASRSIFGRLCCVEFSRYEEGVTIVRVRPVLAMSKDRDVENKPTLPEQVSRRFGLNLVCVLTREAVFSMNTEGLSFLGLESQDALEGRVVTDFVHPDFHVLFKDGAALWQGGEGLIPLKLVSLDGRQVNAQVSVSRFVVQGHDLWFMEASNRKTLCEEELFAIQPSMERHFEEQRILLSREKVALQKAYNDLHRLTYQDELTELGNRRQFVRQLELAVSNESEDNAGILDARGRKKSRFAVFQLDVDNFKLLNASLERRVCDQLLHQIAGLLACFVSNLADAARLGGDEFGLVLARENEETAVELAREILKRFEKPFSIDGKEVYCGCSIGISYFPEHADSAEKLLSMAETALGHSKKHGRGTYQVYSDVLRNQANSESLLEGDFRKAINENSFQVFFQPRIDLKTGRTVGAEALLRWYHKEKRCFISPEIFIPLAERTGLIDALTDFVLTNACVNFIKQWQTRSPGLKVSVNMSGISFRQSNFDQKIKEVLEFTKVPPECLELEITETALMHDFEEADVMLQKLSKLGVGLAIDDFGTGYSSLSYLKRFPVDTLKLDKSFVLKCHENQDDAALVEAMISVAKALGIKVVAEGVELQAHVDYLKSLECEEAQGFFFSKPIPTESFFAWCHEESIQREKAQKAGNAGC